MAKASGSAAAYQKFDRGMMFWFSHEHVIYILYDARNRPRWQQFSDEYDANQPDQDPSLVPPEGRIQPKRGFGFVWRSRAAVRDRIGWGVLAESGYLGAVQIDSVGNRYIQGPAGEVYQLMNDQSDWKQVK